MIKTAVILIFIVTGLIEAIWGLLELYGFLASNHQLYKITGTFFNPAPYAGWLAMVFPCSFAYILTDYKIIQQKSGLPLHYIRLSICLITCIFILLVLPATMSRTAWIATVIASLFVVIAINSSIILSYLKKNKSKVIVMAIFILLLVLVALASLYNLKKDSATGRILMWKISLQTAISNPLGVGLNNFSGYYGEQQAEYFANNKNISDREQLIAGNPAYAFNEYLQISIESGLISSLLFIIFLFIIIKKGIKKSKIPVVGALMALLFFAIASYPFNIVAFIIAFVCLSALCIDIDYDKPNNSRIQIVLLLILLPVAYSCIYQLWQSNKAQQRVQKANSMYIAGIYESALPILEKEYLFLQDDKHYLFMYAQCLSKTKQYEKSNSVLEKAMKISCDPMFYNLIGKNHQELYDFSAAETAFIKASNIVPSKIYPHYLLAKLYHEAGLIKKAEEKAKYIMDKIPKVDSGAVQEMKDEMEKLLEGIK